MVICILRIFASLYICHALLIVNDKYTMNIHNFSPRLSPIHRFSDTPFHSSLFTHHFSVFQFVIANISIIFLLKQSHNSFRRLKPAPTLSLHSSVFSLWSLVLSLWSVFLPSISHCLFKISFQIYIIHSSEQFSFVSKGYLSRFFGNDYDNGIAFLCYTQGSSVSCPHAHIKRRIR